MFSWIDKDLQKELSAAFGSYVRAAIVAVATLYINGVTDTDALWNAAVAAVLAPIIRALNPADLGYGIKKK